MTLIAFIFGVVAGALGSWALENESTWRAELQQARAELDAEVAKSKSQPPKE